MKKQKMTLKSLTVKSFIIAEDDMNTETVKGGGTLLTKPCGSCPCTYQCPTNDIFGCFTRENTGTCCVVGW
ncbi:hypothetical protein C900_05956 [Fulvivirga imtechensis AK7]|uniref:Uncharacterized protein n=1 Tax=Fulvivirga imtechensis AK7 TaxID=1237149 RepID=L8JMP5_9BACT|nr:pinensin family lanthipeptide [Fulvivirga imtechensis]ELR68667.1 hypothetical protein C900_05956 [Fulvivirga imtechensis AK7]